MHLPRDEVSSHQQWCAEKSVSEQYTYIYTLITSGQRVTRHQTRQPRKGGGGCCCSATQYSVSNTGNVARQSSPSKRARKSQEVGAEGRESATIAIIRLLSSFLAPTSSWPSSRSGSRARRTSPALSLVYTESERLYRDSVMRARRRPSGRARGVSRWHSPPKTGPEDAEERVPSSWPSSPSSPGVVVVGSSTMAAKVERERRRYRALGTEQRPSLSGRSVGVARAPISARLSRRRTSRAPR